VCSSDLIRVLQHDDVDPSVTDFVRSYSTVLSLIGDEPNIAPGHIH